jgi:tetratricopeptide (TPR) repeat protein
MRLGRIGFLCAVAMATSLSFGAHAAGKTPAKTAAPAAAPAATPAKPPALADDAKALYDEGSGQYALGHFQEALKDFERVYLLKRLPALLFNIAQCHRQMKNFEEAAVTLRSFIRLAPDSPQIKNARELLKQVEEAQRAQKAAQTMPPLDENGRDVSGESPLAAKPVEARPAPKTEPAVVTSQAKPAPAPAPAVAVVEATPPPPAHKPFYAWISGGAAVAALGAGAVFGIMAKGTASDLTSSPHSRADITDMQSKLSSQAGTANALFIAGGVLAAASGALFVMRY